jgi:guanosine-3',5'-bis(diphosphate) 3'-pyrophosphohydrolase
LSLIYLYGYKNELNMEDKFSFTNEERIEIIQIVKFLHKEIGLTLLEGDEKKIKQHIIGAIENNHIQRDIFGLNPILLELQTAQIAVEEIGLKRDGVLAILLYTSVCDGYTTLEEISHTFGNTVGRIIRGLVKIHDIYKKNPVIESENFRNLLLSFAEDMRVILIMIADRVNIMRQIRDTPNIEARNRVSEEANYLYAPLAHKLGLYKLKSELEDLSLKYLEHDAYYMIKDKLNATKKVRDAYIDSFIEPIKKVLDAAGLNYHMKGRTKSIHSIWQKMKKQKCGFEGIYDLFAIRIILDVPQEQEKMQCWQVYSIITDMYQPNPKRLRDWLSVPKSNGYESLHITVLGPEKKWVEVQIRSQRMDEVAERGLAAHWRYKGVRGESEVDEWLNNILGLDARPGLPAADEAQGAERYATRPVRAQRGAPDRARADRRLRGRSRPHRRRSYAGPAGNRRATGRGPASDPRLRSREGGLARPCEGSGRAAVGGVGDGRGEGLGPTAAQPTEAAILSRPRVRIRASAGPACRSGPS